MAKLFGFEFLRPKPKDEAASFVPQITDDGAVAVVAGGTFGSYIDLDGTVRTESELVTKYREMMLQPECDAAVDEIINEMVAVDEKDPVKIDLDNVNASESIKKVIQEEFLNCLNILDFERHAYEIPKRWYVDGRLYYHVVIDRDHPEKGILEVRYIDPRKIRKIREIIRKPVPGIQSESVLPVTVNEYFAYSDKGFNYGNRSTGPDTVSLKIAKDSILYVPSGLCDTNNTTVLSYLHPAIKPLTQLRTLEDSLVIYRIARAPERRVWRIDCGGLPKAKAEQYVRDIMARHRTKLVYDSQGGAIRDSRRFMSMLEDYWLPIREGGKGTQVDVLPGGQTLGQIDDVVYFRKNFYKSLHVPVDRLDSDDPFSGSKSTEITREEVKFSRFIVRLRSKFATLFNDMLEKQLVLKGIMSIDDWKRIGPYVKYDFAKDNYFAEQKDAEVIASRVELATSIKQAGLVGVYVSNIWLRRNILHQSDDEMKEIDKEIEEETASGEERWMTDLQLQQQQMEQEAQAQGDQGPVESSGGSSSGGDPRGDKFRKVARAKSDYNTLKDRPNRSLADQAKFKSAAQVLARAGQKQALGK